MPFPYFFLRPILANDRSWAALDWRQASTEASDGAARLRYFQDSAATPLATSLPFVTPLTASDLKEGFVEQFAPGQAIFMLPEDGLDDRTLLERCNELHRRRYRFGIRLEHAQRLRAIPVLSFDYLQFDATFARQELTLADLDYCADAGFRKLATGVTSIEMFTWLYNKSFNLFDGEFLTARNAHAEKAPDLTRLKLVKLLNLVKQDGDTHEIEAIFREEPKLSYNLLRLVNSVAVGARTKISNFSQAIAILGRRQLQRWVQLLVYADNLADGNAPNPLMQIAAARGRQMELLCDTIYPVPDVPDLRDNAFMTGLFSLLDVLISLPMGEILKELPLQNEVTEALLATRSNSVLGQLLAAVKAAEQNRLSSAEEILSKLGIGPEAHAKAQVTAFHWASRINTENHP